MNANDITLSPVDTLGELLARIAELTKQAEAIKDSIKDKGSLGLLDKKIVKGKEVQFVEGNLFSATYIGCNKTLFDKEKFVAEFGETKYLEYTKVTTQFSVKVTSR
jgi:hypothetical protein